MRKFSIVQPGTIMFLTKAPGDVRAVAQLARRSSVELIDMLRLIFHKNKIFNAIIISRMVNMMNYLSSSQISTKMFFHNKTVFSNITKWIGVGMFGGFNKYITTSAGYSAPPSGMFIQLSLILKAFPAKTRLILSCEGLIGNLLTTFDTSLIQHIYIIPGGVL